MRNILNYFRTFQHKLDFTNCKFITSGGGGAADAIVLQRRVHGIGRCQVRSARVWGRTAPGDLALELGLHELGGEVAEHQESRSTSALAKVTK